MGKNQAYKSMQRARVGSTSGAPDDAVDDGMVDGSFHTPEWHAARLASLKTSHTITWEEYKKKQKEDELKKGELEKDTDRMMQAYRAQLDAERAHKLANGRNHSHTKSSSTHRKDKKDKDPKKRSSRKRKHSRRGSSDPSSSSSSSESSDSEGDKDARRSKSRSKRGKKEKKHRSQSKRSCRDDESGPVPLSKFFGSMKSPS